MGGFYKILLFLFVLAMHMDAFSQRFLAEDGGTPFKSRLYIGTNLGFSLGSTKMLHLSPYLGFMLTNKFSAGFGVTHHYESLLVQINGGQQLKAEAISRGYRLYCRYNINKLVFAWTEYERINVPLIDPWYTMANREWISGFYLGVGLSKNFREKTALTLTLLYDFLDKGTGLLGQSPTVLRLGFVF